VDHLSGDVPGLRRGEERHRGGDVIGGTRATIAGFGDQALMPGVGQPPAEELAAYGQPGRDRVGGDAARAEFGGEVGRPRFDAGLGRAVRSRAAPRGDRAQRDDPRILREPWRQLTPAQRGELSDLLSLPAAVP
jgi:hypothetical protein